jgi:alpha-amylase
MGKKESDLEEMYQNYYRPFLKALYRFPRLKATLYYSGILLNWIERNHSEFLDVLGELVKRRQVELLGGGFYEPIYSMIPKTDTIGQIELLTTYLRRQFGSRPRGVWIPEEIWEPDYPAAFRSAGMEFSFLGDDQFVGAGVEAGGVFAPLLTEYQGKTLLVFPIHRKLVSDLFSYRPSDFIQHIYDVFPSYLEGGRDPLISLLWDGRFSGGMDSEQASNWLEEFFQQLLVEQESGNLVTWHPNRINRQAQSRGRVYFPPTSYKTLLGRYYDKNQLEAFELLAMPGLGRTGFFYGGMFRQGLARYPEGNLLYGKMQFIHSLVNQVRGDRYRKQAAKEELWRGQSNVPFWFGPSGGIYQSPFRKPSYSALISAELLTREQGIFAPSIVTNDLDMDGVEECLYQGNDLNAYVHLRGGVLFELDYLACPWNYLDTLARHPEPSHNSREELFGYDMYPKKSFVDHFLADDQEFESFRNGSFEPKADLIHQLFTIQDRTTDVAKVLKLDLITEGVVESSSGAQLGLEMKKSYSFEKGKIAVNYTLTNTGSEPLNTLFAPEINLAFASRKVSDLRIFQICNGATKEEVGPDAIELTHSQGIHFDDLHNRISIKVEHDQPRDIWSFPSLTTHSDGFGDHVLYQSSSLVFRIPLHLAAGQVWQGNFSLRFTKEKK